MLIHGMGCYYTGCCVGIRDGVLVYGKVVSIREGVYNMGFLYTGWGVIIRYGVLEYGMGC